MSLQTVKHPNYQLSILYLILNVNYLVNRLSVPSEGEK